MRKHNKKSKKVLLIILSVILAVIIGLCSTFIILYKKGKLEFHKGDSGITASETDNLKISEDTVNYNGKDYVLNNNIVSVLFMGVDKQNMSENSGYGKNGQADSIFVAAVDTETKSVKIIPINRETITDVNVYSAAGKFNETRKEQICLSYAYGDTNEKSCENTKLAVSRYLLGINVSSYVAVDLKGVSVLTDKIGGVTLNPIEKVELESNRKCVPGTEITLKGQDAINYIQSRSEDLDGSVNRLARQKQFLNAFVSTAGNKLMEKFTRLTGYYKAMTPYVTSDLSLSQITYLVSSCLSKDMGNSLQYSSIEGEMKMGKQWGEFIPDNESVTKTVIETFYKEK